MKFLIDANLPFKLARNLKEMGFDVLHTDDLPNKERTTDKEKRKFAVEQNRIVITKETDFLDSHLLQNIPSKLLLVTTGNITNNELIRLFNKNFETMLKLFDSYNLIEFDTEQIIGHEK